ncbi:hypothetical protein [Acidicapsa ligni]|uniref:hypothetical protein n=1 Tax=Acidicapsa ligni TaxID=542300 RepID=UPI0021DFEA49|nr:hypothetical protein [Acidicapsa ligni]
MAASTRPLNLGEILDRTIQLYRNNFLLFVGVSAAPTAISALFSGSASIFLIGHLAELKPTAPDFMKICLQVLGFLIVGMPLIFAAYAVEISATNYAALAITQGDTTTIRASYGKAFQRFWRYVWLLCLEVLLAWIVPYCVFAGIVVVGAIVAALVFKSGPAMAPAAAALLAFLFIILALAVLVTCIWIWLRFSLAFAASVAENTSAWLSIKRSSLLSKGTKGRIFVLCLLLYILSLAVNFALSIPLDILISLASGKSFSFTHPSPAIATLIQVVNLSVGFLVQTIVAPIYSIALMLFYFDQRTRQEGYDIEQLMTQAGWKDLPPVAPPELPITQPSAEPAVSTALQSELPQSIPEALPQSLPEEPLP